MEADKLNFPVFRVRVRRPTPERRIKKKRNSLGILSKEEKKMGKKKVRKKTSN